MIDSIRHIKIHLVLQQKLENYTLLFMDTDKDKRNMRLMLRDGKDIRTNLLENHPVEQEIDSLKEYADYILNNNKDDFFTIYGEIDKIISKIVEGD